MGPLGNQLSAHQFPFSHCPALKHEESFNYHQHHQFLHLHHCFLLQVFQARSRFINICCNQSNQSDFPQRRPLCFKTLLSLFDSTSVDRNKFYKEQQGIPKIPIFSSRNIGLPLLYSRWRPSEERAREQIESLMQSNKQASKLNFALFKEFQSNDVQ